MLWESDGPPGNGPKREGGREREKGETNKKEKETNLEKYISKTFLFVYKMKIRIYHT